MIQSLGSARFLGNGNNSNIFFWEYPTFISNFACSNEKWNSETYVCGLWTLVGVCIRRVYDVPPVTSVCLILLWQTRKDLTNNGILVETHLSCSSTSQPGELLGSSANWANLNSERYKKEIINESECILWFFEQVK